MTYQRFHTDGTYIPCHNRNALLCYSAWPSAAELDAADRLQERLLFAGVPHVVRWDGYGRIRQIYVLEPAKWKAMAWRA